jgi:hypothetical protein
VRDLVAGLGLSMLAIAGLIAFMCWQSRIPHIRTDPTCQLSHQALHVSLDLGFSDRQQSSLLWQLQTVCDRYSEKLPPPAEPVPGP